MPPPLRFPRITSDKFAARTMAVLLPIVLAASALASEMVTVRPEYLPDGLLRNPGMGWVLYDDAAGEVADAETYWQAQDAVAREHASIFYVRWRWSDVEPQEGVYVWDDPESNFSKLIAGARERGLGLAFRFYVNSKDNLRQSTPDWVRLASGDANGVWRNGKWSPHLDDPVFQQKFAAFVAAMGERFNNPAEVEWIDVSSVGSWGEAHGLILADSSYANKVAVYDWLLSTYAQAFDKVLLGMQYGTEFGTANDVSMALEQYDCVLRRDGFGSQWVTHQLDPMEARFPRNAIFAEKAYWNGNEAWRNDSNYDLQSWEDVHRLTLEQALYCHANTLDLRTIWDANEWMKTPGLVERFHREGGYRIALEKATFPSQIVQGDPWSIQHSWRNHGVGVLPNHNQRWGNKYKVALGLYNETTQTPVTTWIDPIAEPGDWVKGQSYQQVLSLSDSQTAGLAPGRYLLTAGIVNTRTDGGADIQLAMTNSTTPSGASIIGQLDVVETSGETRWYWDGNANTTLGKSDNANTSDQAWLSDGFWDDGSTSAPLTSWTAGDSAIFGGSAANQTIHVGNVAIGNLNFAADASYTIANGTLTLGSNTVTTDSDATITSKLDGGQLTKLGSAKLTLSGDNTYSAGTSVKAGTLSVGAIADSGSSHIGNGGILSIEGGTLQYTGSTAATTARALWLARGSARFDITASNGELSLTQPNSYLTNALTKLGPGSLTIASAIAGTATVTVEEGTLQLTGRNNYPGTTTINGGLLVVQGTPGYQSGANGSRLGNLIEVNAAGTLRTDDHHQFGWTGTLADLMINDGGTFDANNKDHYISTLSLGGNAMLNNGSGKYLGLSGGAVNYTGHTASDQTTIPSTLRLRNVPGDAIPTTFTIQGSNPAGDLLVSGVIDSGGDLIKAGTGTLKLSAANTYSGATNVQAGTLALSGSLTSPTTVSAGGKLTGSGTIIAEVTVLSGGTLAPDANATLTTSALNLASGSTLIADGHTAVNGDVNLAGAHLVLTRAPDASPHPLVSYTGSRTGTFASATVPAGWAIEYDNAARVIRLVAGQDSYLEWISGFATEGQSGFNDDANEDGISNGLVFLLGGNPLVRNTTQLPTLEPVPTGGFRYTFQRAARARGHHLAVKLSDDLIHWPQSRDIVIGADTASSGPGVVIIAQGEHDLVTIPIPDSDRRIFMRLALREL